MSKEISNEIYANELDNKAWTSGLVLRRRVDQGIVIGGQVLVRVLELGLEDLKLGVIADDSITIIKQGRKKDDVVIEEEAKIIDKENDAKIIFLKVNQGFFIGDIRDIFVIPLSIGGNGVRIGTRAPLEVSILREELLQRGTNS